MQTACYQVTTLATPPQNVAHAVARVRVLALERLVVAPPAARVSVAEPVVSTALWQGKAHARMEPLVVVGVPPGKAIEEAIRDKPLKRKVKALARADAKRSRGLAGRDAHRGKCQVKGQVRHQVKDRAAIRAEQKGAPRAKGNVDHGLAAWGWMVRVRAHSFLILVRIPRCAVQPAPNNVAAVPAKNRRFVPAVHSLMKSHPPKALICVAWAMRPNRASLQKRWRRAPTSSASACTKCWRNPVTVRAAIWKL